MSTMTPLQLAQSFWLKAAASGRVTITCRDEGTAKRTRFTLYNATKKERAGKGDPAVRAAAEAVQVRVRGSQVILERKEISEQFQVLLGALEEGRVEEEKVEGLAPLVTVQERAKPEDELAALEARLLGAAPSEAPDEPEPPHLKNPYYTRED